MEHAITKGISGRHSASRSSTKDSKTYFSIPGALGAAWHDLLIQKQVCHFPNGSRRLVRPVSVATTPVELER